MSRKHFNLIAKALRELPDTPEKSAIVNALCGLFVQLNPRFNKDYFLAKSSGRLTHVQNKAENS